MGGGRQRVAVVSDRDHDRAVVAGPAHEHDAQDQPDNARYPAPQGASGDRSDDWPGRGDRLEMVAVQDVAVGRHKVDAVHVHPRGRGLVGIGLNDFAIDATRVKVVAKINRYGADNDHNERVVHV